MGIIGGRLGDWMLRSVAPRAKGCAEAHAESSPGKDLKQYFGEDFFDHIKGKTVLDFGSGAGLQAVEMALKGAERVIGLEIQEKLRAEAQDLAQRHSLSERCTFTGRSEELVDIVISKDAFEHFSDPLAVLREMRLRLKPGGFVLAAFGPTWLHP